MTNNTNYDKFMEMLNSKAEIVIPKNIKFSNLEIVCINGRFDISASQLKRGSVTISAASYDKDICGQLKRDGGGSHSTGLAKLLSGVLAPSEINDTTRLDTTFL